jgi:small subunit ribosomal protein S6e
MANFKLIVSNPYDGRSNSYELKDDVAQSLLGLKVGSIIEASNFGIKGKIKITGGSDRSGFPMRSDVLGAVKKYTLLTKGQGLQNVERGQRKRKLVRGNTITEDIYQINAMLTQKIKDFTSPKPVEDAKPVEKNKSTDKGDSSND